MDVTSQRLRHLSLVSAAVLLATDAAFAPPPHRVIARAARPFATPFLASTPGSSGDDAPDESAEGASFAAEFFQAMKERNIVLDDEDLVYDEDEDEGDGAAEASNDDDDDDDEPEINFPAGAINAFTGIDRGDAGEKLAGETTLTNKQIYDEMKERVLESAGAFVELTRHADDDESSGGDNSGGETAKKYKTPDTVPDSGLTAGEVVETVLEALRNNDIPYEDRGVEVLFGYSSPGSQITQLRRDEGLTPAEYKEFLCESDEYERLFDHNDVHIDKADYSLDRKRAFFTARLRFGPSPLDTVSVNFILSTTGHGEDDCWLVDSMLIRPEKMQRRRRR